VRSFEGCGFLAHPQLFAKERVPRFWPTLPEVGLFQPSRLGSYLICTSSLSGSVAGIGVASLCGARHESKIDT
jgi:hypothetical protein